MLYRALLLACFFKTQFHGLESLATQTDDLQIAA